MPPVAPPTAPPPNFYDNLPAAGEMGAGAMGAKPGAGSDADKDIDEELLKAMTGVYRVLTKSAKLKKELKPGIDEIKDKIKELVVQGLKKDPSTLDSGEEKPPAPPAEAAPSGPASASPKTTDETHAA